MAAAFDVVEDVDVDAMVAVGARTTTGAGLDADAGTNAGGRVEVCNRVDCIDCFSAGASDCGVLYGAPKVFVWITAGARTTEPLLACRPSTTHARGGAEGSGGPTVGFGCRVSGGLCENETTGETLDAVRDLASTECSRGHIFGSTANASDC